MKLSFYNYLKIFCFLTLSLIYYNSGQSQTFTFNDSWGDQGLSVKSQSNQKVDVSYSIRQFDINPVLIDGTPMVNIELPAHFLQNDEGFPNLPGNGRYIAVPKGAKVVVNIKSSRIEKYSGLDICPAPRIPLETENGPLFYSKNQEVYSKDAFYPEQPVKISEMSRIRGIDAVMLGITPFQYNPVSKELIIYRDIELEIQFVGGTGEFGEEKYRNRYWDPIIQDAFLNAASIPEMDYSKMVSLRDSKATGYEYLIVIPNNPEFAQWADSIKKFRQKQGILTGVVTLSQIGGNTTTILKNYFINAYNNWDIPPAAVLLLADYGTTATNSIDSPIWNSYCVSDNIYADIDNDMMPEMVFARITANTASQLQVMVSKFLNYERNPPSSAYFYSHPITALGWQTERWFQICSETVGGFFKNVLGKQPVRINAVYEGTPGTTWSTATNTSTVVNYFGPSGRNYIPTSPATLGGWTGGTATVVNTAINAGSFLLQHRDHGMETGWGEPSYTSTNISSLTNTDLTFVMSMNCLTGKYNYSGECFTERFHRYTYNNQNSGALGLIAASEVSYSFVNDALTWGMYDNMWPQFMPDYGNPAIGERGLIPAFGLASAKYFLQQSAWPYNTSNKEVTYNLFHHHGDAFLNLYSEVPQNLMVTSDPILYIGATQFTVSANQGALIALTVNGEIIGTATATGSPLSIPVVAQSQTGNVIITITKQNYYRIEISKPILPPGGPYVTLDAFTIDDSQGNNNGLMDYGETILLNITLKNVGTETAENLVSTLLCSDSYITIINPSALAGTIEAGQSLIITGAFTFDVSGSVPNGHSVNFSVNNSDGTNTWITGLAITAHAPLLQYASYAIADPTGNNNGRLDPGETASLTVNITNGGGSQALNVIGNLTTSSQYITITNNPQTYGTLNQGASAGRVFTISASSSTPTGHTPEFNISLTADGGVTGTGTFNMTVGLIPVLIIDVDPVKNSGTAMQTALQSLGITNHYVTAFPAESTLALYESVFVCLGIYSSNYVLTSANGTLLANYLNLGRKMYMEGGDTWYYDAQTAIQPLFKISASSDGSSDLGTIQGVTGTFAAGLSFTYSGGNSWIDRLNAISPATVILNNLSPAYGTAVAYNGGTYRTIGASHEFGGLNNGTAPSTKIELMKRYLEFLGIANFTVAANFSANPTSLLVNQSVTFSDLSSGNPTTWNWSFPGGTPATSTLQNPVITYNSPGVYDVTLTASNAFTSNSLTKTAYISVLANYTVNGTITYNNSNQTPVNNVSVILLDAQNNALGTTSTSTEGIFSFEQVEPGNYKLAFDCQNGWSSCNATDALLVELHTINMPGFILSGLPLISADVNLSNSVSSLDALYIKQRTVELISGFPSGDWIFDTIPFEVVNQDVTINPVTMCYGDVNCSSTPILKSNIIYPLIYNRKPEYVTPEIIDIPLGVKSIGQIGAITMFLEVSHPDLTVISITPLLTEMVSKVIGNRVKLAWSSENGLDEQDYSEIATIRIMNSSGGQCQNWLTLLDGTEISGVDGRNPGNTEILSGNISGESHLTNNTGLQIYPNPVREVLNVTCMVNRQSEVDFTVMNTFGTEIANETLTHLQEGILEWHKDISEFSAGIYTLRMKVSNGSESYTLVRKFTIIK